MVVTFPGAARRVGRDGGPVVCGLMRADLRGAHAYHRAFVPLQNGPVHGLSNLHGVQKMYQLLELR